MPKIVDHEQRRKSIAMAAVEVIADRGLEATKLTDIGRLAGVTTGAITHYFSDKDAVLTAALEIAYNTMFEGINRVAKRPDHSLFDILAEALPTTRKSRRTMAVWLGFWSRSIAETKVAEQQIAFHHSWHSMIREQLQHHFKLTGQDVPDDIDNIAEGITAQINGLIIRGLVDASDWPKARLHKALNDYLTALGLSR